MKQLIQNTRTGKLSLKQVPEPSVKAGNILVQTRASLISAGTERMVVKFARKSLAKKAAERPDLVKKVLQKARKDGITATIQGVLAQLDSPLPLGYSASGDVVAVGAGLEGQFHVGQRVAVAGAGIATHAELNIIPANLAAEIPIDVPYEDACYATLSSIAMHTVRNLAPSLGDLVAVIGSGLLGQLIVNLLYLAGVRVMAIDYDVSRLELTKKLGAEETITLKKGSENLKSAVSNISNGRGMDGVIISAATETSEPFQIAGKIARDRARICLVGKTGTQIPYREFMQKELSLIVSRSYGPGRYDNDFENQGMKYPEGWIRWTETENLSECLRLMSPSLKKRLNVNVLTSHTYDFDSAEKAYNLIVEGSEPHLGVVLTYKKNKLSHNLVFPRTKFKNTNGCVLGVIGAGSFAKSVILPRLSRMNDIFLKTIATQSGASANKTAETYGFQRSTTNVDNVLKDPDINAILIATRHDTHADFTARALKAGKCVLVEKPLALNREEINKVIKARNTSTGFFQIGFNRRFAHLSEVIQCRLKKQNGIKFLLLRVNAGHIEADSWIHLAHEGGGRVLGEVCHFVDLARCLIASPIISVQANAAKVNEGGCDDLNVTLRFSDGSLATILYTGLGDNTYSKELIEIYSNESVICLDNFQTLTIIEKGKSRKPIKRAQNKGFDKSLQQFVNAVTNNLPAPIDETELIETSLATIAIMESLQSGDRVEIS